MEIIKTNKINHVICDSGPFIANTSIENLGQNIYTLPEVVNEIKDQNTRQRLQVIPYEIKYREPSAEDIKFVVNFAKQTGDYSQLSATDIKVIALTLRIEKEVNGGKHIKDKPMTAKVVKSNNSSNSQLIGFYNKDNDFNRKNDKNIKEDNLEDIEENIGSDEELEDDEDSEDSEDGWITPQNVNEIRKQMMGIKVDDEVDDDVSVGCLTGDFAMQNVLLQMGLKVISIRDGLRIRQTKQFVFRCFACFKIANNWTQFCTHCGNLKTLKRIALTVKDDGTKEININFKKPINIRGTRYSLPTPKAGKHSNNPILVADQPIPQQRGSKFAVDEKKQLNCDKILRDPDYVNRLNPFAINDIYSRASKINTKVRRPVNPNETRRPTGNRKKKNNK